MKPDALLSPRYLSLVLAALLVTGLLFSRALLSIMMASGLLLLLFPSVRPVFGAVCKRPLLFLLAGFFIFFAWLVFLDPQQYTLETKYGANSIGRLGAVEQPLVGAVAV